MLRRLWFARTSFGLILRAFPLPVRPDQSSPTLRLPIDPFLARKSESPGEAWCWKEDTSYLNSSDNHRCSLWRLCRSIVFLGGRQRVTAELQRALTRKPQAVSSAIIFRYQLSSVRARRIRIKEATIVYNLGSLDAQNE